MNLIINKEKTYTELDKVLGVACNEIALKEIKNWCTNCY